ITARALAESVAAPPETGRHRHGLQSCSRELEPLSIRSHSTLLPTFHSVSFGSTNTSPTSVVRVTMPVWLSTAVTVATTPVETGIWLPFWASVMGTIPTTRIPVSKAICTTCRIIGLSFSQGEKAAPETSRGNGASTYRSHWTSRSPPRDGGSHCPGATH